MTCADILVEGAGSTEGTEDLTTLIKNITQEVFFMHTQHAHTHVRLLLQIHFPPSSTSNTNNSTAKDKIYDKVFVSHQIPHLQHEQVPPALSHLLLSLTHLLF